MWTHAHMEVWRFGSLYIKCTKDSYPTCLSMHACNIHNCRFLCCVKVGHLWMCRQEVICSPPEIWNGSWLALRQGFTSRFIPLLLSPSLVPLFCFSFWRCGRGWVSVRIQAFVFVFDWWALNKISKKDFTHPMWACIFGRTCVLCFYVSSGGT